jgi:hypothetical protein
VGLSTRVLALNRAPGSATYWIGHRELMRCGSIRHRRTSCSKAVTHHARMRDDWYNEIGPIPPNGGVRQPWHDDAHRIEGLARRDAQL